MNRIEELEQSIKRQKRMIADREMSESLYFTGRRITDIANLQAMFKELDTLRKEAVNA